MLKFLDDISTQAGEFSEVLAWSDYKNFVHEANNEAIDEILLDSRHQDLQCGFSS